MAGRAIRDRATVVDNAFSRDRYPLGMKDHDGRGRNRVVTA